MRRMLSIRIFPCTNILTYPDDSSTLSREVLQHLGLTSVTVAILAVAIDTVFAAYPLETWLKQGLLTIRQIEAIWCFPVISTGYHSAGFDSASSISHTKNKWVQSTIVPDIRRSNFGGKEIDRVWLYQSPRSLLPARPYLLHPWSRHPYPPQPLPIRRGASPLRERVFRTKRSVTEAIIDNYRTSINYP